MEIHGVEITTLPYSNDHRGNLYELYRDDCIEMPLQPRMAYISATRSGCTRGPHEHRNQTDRFFFLGTSTIWLYLWDNRPSSSTFKAMHLEICSEGKIKEVVIPPGVVHAYRNMGISEGLVLNAPNQLYAGFGRLDEIDEIRYEEDKFKRFKLSEVENANRSTQLHVSGAARK